MSVAFERIKKTFDAFRKRVETFHENKDVLTECQDACEAAYEALYKLKERIDRELGKPAEKCDLTKDERKFCVNLFKDNFLGSMLRLRNVATHVVNDGAIKSKSFTLNLPDGSPIELDCSASANAVFSHDIFALPNESRGVNHIKHSHVLREAEKRITKKMRKIESSVQPT